MSKKRKPDSRRLVVDANVLRGASRTDGGPPAGVRCRGVLQAVLRICHRAVVSPALAQEYDNHASGFATRWLVAMRRKGKIVHTGAAATRRSRGWLQETSYSPAERAAVEKDLHLVLAAWETEQRVISADMNAARLFARIEDLATMVWADVQAGGVEDWLAGGAPDGEQTLADIAEPISTTRHDRR